jgi:hypothetical protein
VRPATTEQHVVEAQASGAAGETGTNVATANHPSVLLSLARATAADGRQRGVGAQDPEELEALRDQARTEIIALPPDDTTRFVLPWPWQADNTDGQALTPEGEEFGYELRFSRYKKMQITRRSTRTASRRHEAAVGTGWKESLHRGRFVRTSWLLTPASCETRPTEHEAQR